MNTSLRCTSAASSLGRACALAAALLLVQLGSPVAAQAAFGTNLIINPGAEAGSGNANGDAVGAGNVPDWSNTAEFTVVQYGPDYGFPTAGDPGPADRGTNFFAGGPDNSLSWAEQTIDVSFASAQIDGAGVNYSLSGWLGGFLDNGDNAVLTAEFRNGASVLGSASIGPVSASDRGNATALLFREATGVVPVNTDGVRFLLTMTRPGGSVYNDGYADNLSFTLTPVPEPGPWLLTLAGLALVALRVRRGA